MTGFGNSALYQEIYQQLAGSKTEAANIAATYDYAPRQYAVQELDPSSGLPQTPDGQWLVGPNSKPVVNPINVLLKATAQGGFETKDGTAVYYQRGVLMDAQSGTPYIATDATRYQGPYKAKEMALTLAGYIANPVLDETHTRKVDGTATAMFVMLQAYPWAALTSLIGTLSVILFFVTSSDSASMVADIIASGGSQDPTTGTRLFWGILEGVLAAVLLLAGGLKALQTGSITIGLPFCIIIILMCFSLVRGLAREMAGDIPAAHKKHIQTGAS
jgi:hypothetical protein